MYAALEHGPVLCSDSNILCLSWKGRVPRREQAKPVCRRRCYEEGWLATGNGRGVVGVTFTSSRCKRDHTTPQRINFNLRGHNSEVVLVRWNEPFQKLATCDADGGIFVWIQYEGRWSVELVNDRGAQVSDFTWSHDGTQALISYRDGFVLVGSVNGQRHWSSEINLESQITCGIWTPDDQQVLFGTADGQVIVMDCHGRMMAHLVLQEAEGIMSMTWSYPSFLMEDCSESDTDSDDCAPFQGIHKYNPIPMNLRPLLTVTFTSGDISLMSNYDDLTPTRINTGLKDVVVQWSSQGNLFAVAGLERQAVTNDSTISPATKKAVVKFYNLHGEHIFLLETPAQKPISTLCWGHKDSRLFLACGPALYVVRVDHRVASLQLLCQQVIASALREEKVVAKLTIPSCLSTYVSSAFAPTIKPPVPDVSNMRDFVSYPTSGNERLYCTMKRTEDDLEVGGPCYTLYLEYLGGLVPILKGRRISKLRPEFVIMDPKTDGKADELYGNTLISTVVDSCNCSDSSDIELVDDWVGKRSPKMSRGSKSPRLPRVNIDTRKSPKLSRAAQEISRSPRLPIRKSSIGSPSLSRKEFPLEDTAQHNYLAQVTSNIWGTKFKIVGLASFLPTNLGAVTYKTSLLHLQPRQMTIYLPEVRKVSTECISLPVFSSHVFSEDEDDLTGTGTPGIIDANPPCTVNIPIAPIHSPGQAMSPTQSIGLVQSLLANQNVQLGVLSSPTMMSPNYVPDQGGNTLLITQHAVPASSDQLKKKPSCPTPQMAEGDAVVFRASLDINKITSTPPYSGIVATAVAATTAGSFSATPLPEDACLKKGDNNLHPSDTQTVLHPTPLGYERITTFDSSGNVEEVCRPRTRLLCNQNLYTVHYSGSSATLRASTSGEKKGQLPYASTTLKNCSSPRYSIPPGDPPPYPEAVSWTCTLQNPRQRFDNNRCAKTMLQKTLPSKTKASTLSVSYQQRGPMAFYTCSECSSSRSGTCVGAMSSADNGISGGTVIRQDFPLAVSGLLHSTVMVPSTGTLLMPLQSSSNFISSDCKDSLIGGSGIRDRADIVNSTITKNVLLNHSLGQLALTTEENDLTMKQPPPCQLDSSATEEIWVPQDQTDNITTTVHPGSLNPLPLILSPTQHIGFSCLPFTLSPNSPAPPSDTNFHGTGSYQMTLSFSPSINSGDSQPQPSYTSPKELGAPPFSQHDQTLVLPPEYLPNLTSLTCCPLSPSVSSCSSLPMNPVLYSWGSHNPCSHVPTPPGTAPVLPEKAFHRLEKPFLTPTSQTPPLLLPSTDMQGLEKGTSEAAEGFHMGLSLGKSPVPPCTDMFGKKNQKRLDSGRTDEGNVLAITESCNKSRKEGRALGDFNSFISSPRLGCRDKKKTKGQKEQQKAKKISKVTTSEFQDSSDTEPELIISGDELMNHNQSSKKGWKSKRSLRSSGCELDDIKSRKVCEKEDRGLGNQGFVYIMANKQPLWNEATQVYQLDFGGRVTQESAKNFQIELEGKQVMQFGRTDGNAYILDFQHPFSAVQAFAVALANVTQRLK
uniref:Tubby C-terminal domain-containing protein n=1 Tax=Pygocentrus nattereri TaxID=42514 RepID=A0AAR2K3Q0_PYGNA